LDVLRVGQRRRDRRAVEREARDVPRVLLAAAPLREPAPVARSAREVEARERRAEGARDRDAPEPGSHDESRSAPEPRELLEAEEALEGEACAHALVGGRVLLELLEAAEAAHRARGALEGAAVAGAAHALDELVRGHVGREAAVELLA